MDDKERAIIEDFASLVELMIEDLRKTFPDLDKPLNLFNPGPTMTTADKLFIESFNVMADRVHETAVAKGWWEKERNDGEVIALMHSELSEALEAIRDGNQPDDKVPEFSGVEAEFADVIIRIMDVAKVRGWRVAEALVAKAEVNRSRAYKHGGKAF